MAGAAAALVVAGCVLWTVRDRASIAATGGADLSATQALPDLLTQIYRAYALEDETAIYDALSQAVSENIVTDLYLQRRQAQVADHAENGQTQILSVEVYEVTSLPGAHTYRVAWRVVGRVRHVAHIHERINLYAADLTLAQLKGAWKLTGFILTDANREADFDFEGGE